MTQPDPRTIEVSYQFGGQQLEYRVRSSIPLFADRADAALPIGLLPAMRLGLPLHLPGTVSPALLEHTPRIQDILDGFTGGQLRNAPIVASSGNGAGLRAPGVGVFFSGGVDSFFTALRHSHDVTHLVFVRGFDIFDIDSDRGSAALDAARRTAGELDKQLIEVDTNLREVTMPFAQWGLAHGPALAAIALLLQSQLGRVLIPSSYTYSTLFPWGSHPLLDPLWSTEQIDVVHDGSESPRPVKVDLLATSPVAMRSLRVCNRQHTTYNCGACEKCLRTMMNLRLSGALDRCSTFPVPLDLRRVARQTHSDEHTRAFARENLARAHERRDWPAAAALALSLRPRPLLELRHRAGRLRRRLAKATRRRRAKLEPATLVH